MATPRAGALKQPLIQSSTGGLPTRFVSSRDSSRTSSDSGSTSKRSRSLVLLTGLFSALAVSTLMLFMLTNMQASAQATTAAQAFSGNRRIFPGSQKAASIQQLYDRAAAASAVLSGSSSTAVDKIGSAVTSAAKQVVAVAHKAANSAASLHPFQHLKHYYSLQPVDNSPRCQHTGICDGLHSPGPDNLGNVTDAKARQDHVRKAIAWSWEGYRKYAWGQDEVEVVSRRPKAWFNLGLTIVDSLDTLLIAGLNEEYQQARGWVADHLEFKDGSRVQFFEVNIRILGGLLSAYYLSGRDEVYLQKAQDLADRLMVAFNTSTGMPAPYVVFQDAEGRRKSGIANAKTNIAEAGTMSLEFTTLGRLLGRDDMYDAGMKFWHVLASHSSYDGLYCMGIDTANADCTDPKISIGASADSMYEYMLKQWLLSGKRQEEPLNLYKAAMAGTRKHLVRHAYDGTAELSFVSEASVQSTGVISGTNDRFEHLTCFAGGMFVLGKLNGISTNVTADDLDDVSLGARIGRACYELYHQAASGLAPDSVQYQNKAGGNLPAVNPVPMTNIRALAGQQLQPHSSGIAGRLREGSDLAQQQHQLQPQEAPAPEKSSAPPAVIASWNLQSKADFLRPEAVETLFYLWRATGDEIYREWGWNMFRAFERYCRMDTGGYSTLDDVTQVPPKRGDKMESFWIAETLKYFYLLFEDDPSVLPLDKWVFNTEAHPLPIWGTQEDSQAMQSTKQRRDAARAAAQVSLSTPLQQQQQQQPVLP